MKVKFNKLYNMAKKIEYLQVEYSKFPSATELNEEGEDGWDLIEIHQEDKRFYDCEIEYFYIQKIYLATFKREIVYETLRKRKSNCLY